MPWVQDHGGDWVNLACCFSLTIETVVQAGGAPIYQLQASSGSTLYAVLFESLDAQAVQEVRDSLMAHLEIVPPSGVPAEIVAVMSTSHAKSPEKARKRLYHNR